MVTMKKMRMWKKLYLKNNAETNRHAKYENDIEDYIKFVPINGCDIFYIDKKELEK